jgi:hypothetical protein
MTLGYPLVFEAVTPPTRPGPRFRVGGAVSSLDLYLLSDLERGTRDLARALAGVMVRAPWHS